VSRERAVIAAGIGIAVGYLLKDQLDQYRSLTPDEALESAKQTFMKQGPVSGSWIYMKPEKIERNGLTYTAYRGGITRTIDGENKQYEFFADADTGAVIDAKP